MLFPVTFKDFIIVFLSFHSWPLSYIVLMYMSQTTQYIITVFVSTVIFERYLNNKENVVATSRCSVFLPADLRFVVVCFPSAWTSVNISDTEGLLVTIYFSFCVSEKVCFTFVLKGIFDEYRILSWQVFFSLCIVSNKQSDVIVILIFVLLCLRSPPRSGDLYHWFGWFCYGVPRCYFLHVSYAYSSVNFLDTCVLVFISFGKILAIVSSKILNPLQLNVRVLKIEALLIFKNSFFSVFNFV